MVSLPGGPSRSEEVEPRVSPHLSAMCGSCAVIQTLVLLQSRCAGSPITCRQPPDPEESVEEAGVKAGSHSPGFFNPAVSPKVVVVKFLYLRPLLAGTDVFRSIEDLARVFKSSLVSMSFSGCLRNSA